MVTHPSTDVIKRATGQYRPYLLLGMGVLLIFFTRERWAVPLLAWMAPVPFLLFLQQSSGWRRALLFLGVFCLGTVISLSKSFQPPWPRVMALAFGVPIGLALGSVYLWWAWLQRHSTRWIGNLSFAAAITAMEWTLYSFTPFGSIGCTANTQVDNLPLLQSLSFFGIGGLGFLINWGAAVLSQSVAEKRIPGIQGAVLASLVVFLHIFGTLRIGSPSPSPTATLAAVGTDFDWFATPEIPPVEQRRKVTNALMRRTEVAADKGAQMVVWSEISNMIDPEDENAVIQRAQFISRQKSIHIILSYLKLLSSNPLRWENKYVWITPKGNIADTYLKHKPAGPVEPAVAGMGAPRVMDTGFGKAAGAICFDFDFPQIGLTLARGGVDFVFVPGADSPSIDPYHAQVATMRAIEGGYSVIRPARHGTSIGADPFGRIRGWLSANETDKKIMLVTIPTRKVWTLYKTVGDVVPWLSIVFLLCLTAWRGRHIFRSARL
jgi:apolipoprotein N-acyltransferase